MSADSDNDSDAQEGVSSLSHMNCIVSPAKNVSNHVLHWISARAPDDAARHGAGMSMKETIWPACSVLLYDDWRYNRQVGTVNAEMALNGQKWPLLTFCFGDRESIRLISRKML
ncbi:MAG TPA: hypothetical protein DCG57_17490 [Candidatus Riflebacteria bacterium]|jgi:hypothetical protein|nr:hypothetical protein [Candidatus Riflebacteria bacterium]